MQYSVQYAVGDTFFMFHMTVVRRLTSEQVVSVVDELHDNNIPRDRNDDRLDNGDG